MFLTREKYIFEGFIEGTSESYYWSLILPNFPSFEGATLRTSWNLKLLLDQVQHQEILTNLKLFQSVEEFLGTLKKVTSSDTNSTKIRRSHVFYEQIFKELEVVGPSAVIKPDFSGVVISRSDSGTRNHNLTVDLPQNYPKEWVRISSHQLPLTRGISLENNPDFAGVTTVVQCYQTFCELIDLFQPFWNAMDILDASCLVLEPETPLYSDFYRRIQISDSCSALLTFNPYFSHQMPAIEFLGEDDEVLQFRNYLEKNLIDIQWDSEVDVHLNLLSLLNLKEFPMKVNFPNDEANLLQPGECGICFEDRLDGHPANLRCDNAKCTSLYHQVCLIKYLCSNRSNSRMKNAIFGRCPTCTDTIGCSTLSWTHFQ